MGHAEQMLGLYHRIWIISGIAGTAFLTMAVGMFFRFRIFRIWKKRHWIFLLAVVVLVWQGKTGSTAAYAKEKELQEQTGERETGETGEGEEKEQPGEKKSMEPEEQKPENQEQRKEPEEQGREQREKQEAEQETEQSWDTKVPEVRVIWKNEQGEKWKDFYHTGRELVMELEIREEHLNKEQTWIQAEACDAAGNTLDIEEIQEINGKNWAQLMVLRESQAEEQSKAGEAPFWELQEEGDRYRFTLYLKSEACYHISAHIQDTSGNIPKEAGEEGLLDLGSFCLDRTAPSVPDETGILLEAEHQTLMEKLLNKITFGYFCQPVLNVKIQAFDKISGVKGITYICEGMGGDDVWEPYEITGTAKAGETLICSENGSRAFVSFCLPASFSGTIRAQAWDQAGHHMEEWTESTGILVESEEMHQRSSRIEWSLPEHGDRKEYFFREDVNLSFVMEDTFSGIHSLRIQAGTEEEEQEFGEAGQELLTVRETNVVLPASKNNQNQISISAEFRDFAGYITKLTEAPIIHIDTQPPRVEVEWQNKDVRNENYFRENQTAHIRVQERNFLPEKTELTVTGMEPAVLSWTHQAGEGCRASASWTDRNHGDTCIWESVLEFGEDGSYTFGFSCEDAAGNRGTYGKTDAFVIDKTPPVLDVHWDNSQPQNECYYAKSRSAVVEVREANLGPEDLKVHVEAYRDGQDKAPPSMGTLRQWEEGSWRAGITFAEDGRFRMRIHCTDLAGNEAVFYESEEFVIDQTPPEVVFENVADCSANQGSVAPILHVRDDNFDPEKTHISFAGSSKTGQTPACAKSQMENGFTLLWGDFEHLPQNDDLYRIQAAAADLAGNTVKKTLTFSVNRFGSVYELEEATAKLAGPGGSRYAAEEPELVITEYNPDYLDYYQIICSREGETAELQKGRDYQVEETGTEDTWKAYRYRIGKENFQKEGIYRVTLYSEDRAKNASSSQGKKKSLEFIVDKTGPGIVIHGVKDRERIAGDSLKIRADVWDTFLLDRAEIYVNGNCVLSADARVLEESEGSLACRISGSKAWQTLVVKAWDRAGNMTETETVRFLLTEQTAFLFLGGSGIGSITAFLLAAAFGLSALIWILRSRWKMDEGE